MANENLTKKELDKLAKDVLADGVVDFDETTKLLELHVLRRLRDARRHEPEQSRRLVEIHDTVRQDVLCELVQFFVRQVLISHMAHLDFQFQTACGRSPPR